MKNKVILILSLLLALTLNLSSCNNAPDITSAVQTEAEPGIQPQMKIIFADVGKADFILICCDGKYMIIDSGYKKNKDRIFEILDNNGVKTIEYAVATHPDKDHIGSMADIIENYSVKNLLISPVESTDKLYTKMIKAAKNTGCTVTKASIGFEFEFCKAHFTVYSPNKALTVLADENEASVVMMMRYGERRVLFTGDAQYIAETEMINNPALDLQADVIKIGHHGSEQASTEGFIMRVGAKYAVISTGNDEEPYPAEITLETLKKYKTGIYRTDTDGDIILTTNGKYLNFSKSGKAEQ